MIKKSLKNQFLLKCLFLFFMTIIIFSLHYNIEAFSESYWLQTNGSWEVELEPSFNGNFVSLVNSKTSKGTNPTLTLSVKSSGKPEGSGDGEGSIWEIYVERQNDKNWPSGLTLGVTRTSEGSGNGEIIEDPSSSNSNETYVEVDSDPDGMGSLFLKGKGRLNNISIELKLTNLQLLISSDNSLSDLITNGISTKVVYHISKVQTSS